MAHQNNRYYNLFANQNLTLCISNSLSNLKPILFQNEINLFLYIQKALLYLNKIKI